MWPGWTMPIIESMKIYMPDEYSNERWLKRAFTSLKWCLWPRRCHVSGRWMWLTLAYKSDYIITGPGDAAVWTRWYSPTEMLVLKLKYDI